MIAHTIDGYPLTDTERDWPPLAESEHRPLHRAVLDALGPLDGHGLLDVGCGVGLFLQAAEQRGALVAGTDTEVARLEIARWALPDADLRVGGLVNAGDALPFDNGTFDVVIERSLPSAAASTATAPGADRTAVLAELARVVRPGGRVAVGSWVRPTGCWVEEFTDHLRRLALLPTTAEAEETLDDVVGAAGLSILVGGSVHLTATFPNIGAAWTALLGSEQILRAVRLAGEETVRDAFGASVSGSVDAEGVVQLSKAFRYVVATAPVSTMWAVPTQVDNESGSVPERRDGREELTHRRGHG